MGHRVDDQNLKAMYFENFLFQRLVGWWAALEDTFFPDRIRVGTADKRIWHNGLMIKIKPCLLKIFCCRLVGWWAALEDTHSPELLCAGEPCK